MVYPLQFRHREARWRGTKQQFWNSVQLLQRYGKTTYKCWPVFSLVRICHPVGEEKLNPPIRFDRPRRRLRTHGHTVGIARDFCRTHSFLLSQTFLSELLLLAPISRGFLSLILAATGLSKPSLSLRCIWWEKISLKAEIEPLGIEHNKLDRNSLGLGCTLNLLSSIYFSNALLNQWTTIFGMHLVSL